MSGGLDIEGVLARALSEWQIIGVRAEHDPSCDGDCIDRCPVPVQYEVSIDEAASHVAAVLREQIAAAQAKAWDRCFRYYGLGARDPENPYRAALAAPSRVPGEET